MANIISSLVIIMILINIASGAILIGINDSNSPTGDNAFDIGDTYSLRYQENYGDNLTIINELENPINPSSTNVEDAGDRIYRVLDVITLGFVFRFISSVETFMFGFVHILDNVVGPMLDSDLRDMLFGPTVDGEQLHGVLHQIIKLLYILAGIQLLTGKNVFGEGY
ncbi:MAG: hypothetical protein PHC75_10570 [Burkholderiales bacterium]|nr:hypothetical protein [Burkholderiales bacterium]